MSSPATLLVQARMGSARLPGKVLTDICGQPLLQWLLTRIEGTRMTRGVVVATTTEPADDAVEALCNDLGVRVFRGDEQDVLRRMREAAHAFGAETVARISADSPLIDRQTVEAVLDAFAESSHDIVQNHRPPAWPVGTAVEVMTMSALEQIDQLATEPADREHVTLYAYRHPERFSTSFVPPPRALEQPSLRLCIDTPEDLERVREICRVLGPGRDFGLSDIVERFGG